MPRIPGLTLMVAHRQIAKLCPQDLEHLINCGLSAAA
jgi:hypothetical protein